MYPLTFARILVMLKKINLFTATSLFSLGVGVQAAPVIFVDAPRDGQSVTGIIQIFGWASDVIEVEKVTLQTGNNSELKIGYGGERQDVSVRRTADDDPDHTGFSTALNTHLLANGRHTITLAANNVRGETTTVNFDIVVFNPSGGNSRDSVDLSTASVRIQGQNIILDQITINGQGSSNVELSFDASTNGFHLSAMGTASVNETSTLRGKEAYIEYGCAQSACHAIDPVANQNQVLIGGQQDVITAALANVPQMAMVASEIAGDQGVVMRIADYLDNLK